MVYTGPLIKRMCVHSSVWEDKQTPALVQVRRSRVLLHTSQHAGHYQRYPSTAKHPSLAAWHTTPNLHCPLAPWPMVCSAGGSPELWEGYPYCLAERAAQSCSMQVSPSEPQWGGRNEDPNLGLGSPQAQASQLWGGAGCHLGWRNFPHPHLGLFPAGGRAHKMGRIPLPHLSSSRLRSSQWGGPCTTGEFIVSPLGWEASQPCQLRVSASYPGEWRPLPLQSQVYPEMGFSQLWGALCCRIFPVSSALGWDLPNRVEPHPMLLGRVQSGGWLNRGGRTAPTTGKTLPQGCQDQVMGLHSPLLQRVKGRNSCGARSWSGPAGMWETLLWFAPSAPLGRP